MEWYVCYSLLIVGCIVGRDVCCVVGREVVSGMRVVIGGGGGSRDVC